MVFKLLLPGLLLVIQHSHPLPHLALSFFPFIFLHSFFATQVPLADLQGFDALHFSFPFLMSIFSAKKT